MRMEHSLWIRSRVWRSSGMREGVINHYLSEELGGLLLVDVCGKVRDVQPVLSAMPLHLCKLDYQRFSILRATRLCS